MRCSVPSQDGYRWCAACKARHPISDFGKDKNRIDGLATSCKKVVSRRNKSYHERHRQFLNRRHKINQESRRYSPERSLWIKKRMISGARRHAKHRNIEFKLSIQDFEISETCPVFGMKLDLSVSTKRTFNSPSLDRIDNSKGYIPDNVWVISWRANDVKGNATVDELRTVADAIERYIGHKAAGRLLDGREWNEMP